MTKGFTTMSFQYPAVSVVIPTKDRPALLLRAISSSLSQIEVSVEVVVVIDGKDDGSVSSLVSREFPGVKVISLGRSMGSNAARMAGVVESRYDYIAFLDDDDTWVPRKLEQQLRLWRESGCDTNAIVSCRVFAKSPLSEVVWPRLIYQKGSPICDYLFVRKSIRRGEALVQTSTLLTHKEVLLKAPFATALKMHQDWQFLIDAQIAGVAILMHPEPLVTWFIEENRRQTAPDWKFSLSWMGANAAHFSDRARMGFVCGLVAPCAAQGKFLDRFRVFPRMFDNGWPTPVEFMLFVISICVPHSFRKLGRALIARIPRVP